MTSSRGQNVSVFQHSGSERWRPASITVIADSRVNLPCDPRKNILTFGENTSVIEKNSGQHLHKTPSTGAYANSRCKENSFSTAYSSALMTGSANSSAVLGSGNRELSPVRWCDRKVDGVYLGRSGWVQVHHRSLDDGKGVLYCDGSGFFTLPARKPFSASDSNAGEPRHGNRPFHLPLPSKKRIVRESHERPSKFVQEFESVSPPSVTPIISPPPAFKDDGSNVEFSRNSTKNAFRCEESFLPIPGSSSGSPKERRITVQMLPPEIPLGSTASSTLRNDCRPHRTRQMKFLDDEFSSRIWHEPSFNSAGPFSAVEFRSPENGTATASKGVLKVSDGNSFYENFETAKEKLNCDECGKEEDSRDYDCYEMIDANEYLSRFHNSSIEELNGQRNSSKVFRQKNHQRNGRRTSSSYKTRSSSSDSSSSDCNFSDKNPEKVASSRKTNPREKPSFEFEHSSSRSSKQFHVKRSRSLQLSEKRSPSESLLNCSSSGKSWDPMPPEHSAFSKSANQNNENSARFPQSLRHVLVTVHGDSIPVGDYSNRSLDSLGKITTSEEEQKKLIAEAEKEARIISEFLNGSRSRTAARNLLMHRYLNRREDVGSIELSENLPPTAEYDVHFSETYRRDNFRKKNKSTSSNLVPRQHTTSSNSKPFAYFFRASGAFNPTGSSVPHQNLPGQGKKERAEHKTGAGSNSSFLNSYSKVRLPKNKSENANRFPVDVYENSKIEKLNPFAPSEKKVPKNEIFESGPEVLKSTLKNSPQLLTAKKVAKTEDVSFVESSSPSSSSSSSPDICRLDFDTKSIKKIKNMDSSILGEDSVITAGNPRTPSTFRADSAPESDDSTAAGVYQRSLSLPRSFLSDRYRSDCTNRRDLLRWKTCDEETFEETASEPPMDSQRSRTAPTTPTRDLRYCRRQEGVSQIQCYGSSSTSLVRESAFSSPRRIAETFTSGDTESFNLKETSAFFIYKNHQQMSENSTETALQKCKGNFPLRYLKAKDFNELMHRETESGRDENSRDAISTACHLMSGLQTVDGGEKAFAFTTEKTRHKKGPKNEKYDSHDSGIQMGNRGNIDSSESQDTDFQEDTNSPLLGDMQQRARSKKPGYQKGVRRANSDVGGQKPFRSEVKNSGRGLFLAACPPPAEDRRSTAVWEPCSPLSAATRNKNIAECSGRLAGTQLRRSLSQPLGLNDFAPFSRSPMLKCFALGEGEKNLLEKNSEDECLSDSESSVASLLERKKSLDFPSSTETAVLAEALWDHVAIESCELPFRAGDVIEVLDTQNWDWWWGATAENRGYFPSAFVRLRVNQEDTVEDCLAAIAKGKYASSRVRRGKSVSLLSNDQVRSSVVSELLSTEQDFVKILHDLKDGYIDQCKRRTDMFTSAQITTIFSNLEDLLDFQEKFLNDLEATVDKEFPYKSCIGKVFLTHGSGFRMYSEYCNSHPMAMATLQDLYQKNGYCKFFETCRLKQSLIEIPLDGYLLTPVQRICKYPLQLAELLKYTKPDHPDFREVEEALETMRAVATLINERKRKMESLEKLAAWQQRVEGWVGEDLIEISSRLIHQGDVVRITSGVWTSNITLFLFDHQIVYCKKDLLKRNVYIYKGRIFLDASVVVDVPDGKNQQLGVTVKYGLKICSGLNDKWLLFCCRSREDKAKWLEALAEEKILVARDREVGLDLPPTAKILAKMAARTKKCPPYKPRGKNKFASNHEEMSFRNCRSSTSKSKYSRRVGTWFTFGGVMKNSKTSPRPRTSLNRIA